MSHDQKKVLGKILLEQQAVRPQDLERVAATREPGGPPLASRLIEAGLVTELEALKALSAQRGVPGLDLHQICIKLIDLSSIPREIALVHKLLAVLDRQDRIFIAMANPEDKKVIEEIEFVTGKRVFAYIALEATLLRAIRDAYDARDRGETHYVGPTCPAEVLRRAGLDPRHYGRGDQPAAATAPPASPSPPPPMAAPGPGAPPAQPAPAAAARTAARPGGSAHGSSDSIPRAAPAGAAPATASRPPAARPGGFASPIARVEFQSAAPPAPSPSAAPPVGLGGLTPPTGKGSSASFRAVPANTESRFRPSTSRMQAVKPSVVVDPKMEQAVDAEINEADFGDLNEEVSIAGQPLPKEAVPVPAGKKKVLIVDDEREIRVLIRRLLEERGHIVVEADRGKLALQMLKLENPDLVVLDAMLPEVHGFDIAKRIRGSTRYGHIPIIMVSAVYRGWRFAQDAKQSYGVDAYLEKPFRVQELVTVIETALKDGRTPADPERMSSDAEKLLNDGVEAYRAGDLERATELLQRGVVIDPFAYRLRFHLGLLLGKRGLLYDAIEQLERAVQIQGLHFPSLKNLAILYQQAGFRNKALEAWERALGAAPDDDTKRAIKEHIVSLL
ncbi:MAG: response regulator [Polyangiaceae bacterium]|nr:response regulator [Polyangiaceae bacterium]